jgi:hypothetical protein
MFKPYNIIQVKKIKLFPLTPPLSSDWRNPGHLTDSGQDHWVEGTLIASSQREVFSNYSLSPAGRGMG